MTSRGVEVSADTAPAQWIAPRLGGSFGAVSRTVPAGYEAYARICHPVDDGRGGLTTWPEVARVTGRHAHPLMQWHALVGSSDSSNMEGSLWPAGNPERGNFDEHVLAVLCGLLAALTNTRRYWFCLWDGYGWIGDDHDDPQNTSSATKGEARSAKVERRAPRPFSPTESLSPRVELPGRSYLLLTGPLSDALKIGWLMTADVRSFVAQSPNLFWPADRAWCVATEIDFDSTLVGGTRALIRAILDAPTLDSWPVGPGDSLAADGDHVNFVP